MNDYIGEPPPSLDRLPLNVGEQVTIYGWAVGVGGLGFFECTVVRHLVGGFMFLATGPDGTFSRRFDDENDQWARGWGTEAVGALRATIALEDSR